MLFDIANKHMPTTNNNTNRRKNKNGSDNRLFTNSFIETKI